MKYYFTVPAVLMIAMLHFTANITASEKSLLNNDPDVIYLEEHIGHRVELLVVKEAVVYGDKKGNRRLGVYPVDTKLELLALSDKAYRVKGQAAHAGVSGWVDPKLLASKDKDFIVNLKQLYERQMIVKELVANQDVAIGMTLKEVASSLGEPTETEVKQTREGDSGQWDYVVSEEKKHYNYVYDRNTGQQFRQLSHVTTEEKSRTTLEFENDVVTSIMRKRTNGRGKVRIISSPIVFNF